MPSIITAEETSHRLQGLLDLRVQGPRLDGDNLRRRIRVVGNGRVTLGAEDAVDGLARAADAGPALGRPVQGELVLGDDSDEGCRSGQHDQLIDR